MTVVAAAAQQAGPTLGARQHEQHKAIPAASHYYGRINVFSIANPSPMSSQSKRLGFIVPISGLDQYKKCSKFEIDWMTKLTSKSLKKSKLEFGQL